MSVFVTVQCVSCKTEREIKPYHIAPGEIPMCDKCFSPMVVKTATYDPRQS